MQGLSGTNPTRQHPDSSLPATRHAQLPLSFLGVQFGLLSLERTATAPLSNQPLSRVPALSPLTKRGNKGGAKGPEWLELDID